VSHARHGQHDLAIADFTEVIRQNPKDFTAYTERGKSYRMKGKPDLAIADFTQVITLVVGEKGFSSNAVAGGLAPAYYGRGLAYADEGKHDQAIADFTEAIRINPYPQEDHRDRGLSFASKGEYEHAIADFTEAIRLGPNDVKSYIGRGQSYAGQGKFDQAIDDYTEAIQLDPKCTAAFVNRAAAYRALGDQPKAAQDERMAQEIRVPRSQGPQVTQKGRQGPAVPFLPFGDDRMMSVTMLALLSHDHEVQKELKLSDEQIKKAGHLAEELGKKELDQSASIKAMYPSGGPRMEEAMRINVSKERKKAIASMLASDQEKRLRQLARQHLGLRAFSLPEVQEALNLSDEQKDKIKTMDKDFAREVSQGGFEKMEALRQEAVNNATVILSESQKAAWNNLVGEPFHFEVPQVRASGAKK
jgi:Flp pilus assembly protein TadD